MGWSGTNYVEDRLGLRGAPGSSNPGANVILMGAVSAGAVVPVHGSHLQPQATRVRQVQRPMRLQPASRP